MRRRIWKHAAFGVAALAAALALHACAVDGHAAGVVTVPNPLGPDFEVGFTAGTEGSTCSVDGGPGNANVCIEVIWSDANGETLGSSEFETDSSGHASGPVPAGAVRWEAKFVDCPDPEPEEDRDEAPDGGALLAQVPQVGGTQRIPQFGGPQEFLVAGGPIVPSDAPGASNLSYAYFVEAESAAHVDALLEPILAVGPGAPVHPAVQVLHHATVTTTVAGLRVVQAQPGAFESWSLDVNGGAFYADLSSSLTYAVGGWEVVECVVPFEALDLGVVPGATYSNAASTVHQTDSLPGPVSVAWDFVLEP